MRIAIYARYSTDMQNAKSCIDQINLVKERLGPEHDYSIFHDDAISGTHDENRPSYQELMAQMRLTPCPFDMLATEGLSRLHRNLAKGAALYDEMEFLGVQVWAANEGGVVNRVTNAFKGIQNQDYVTNARAQVKRGQKAKILSGGMVTPPCYGYGVVKRFGEDGEPVKGERFIKEDEAAVIRRMFEMFASGLSAHKIAGVLNREGIPSPKGGLWAPTSILGKIELKKAGGMLRNPLYDGRFIFNATTTAKNPRTGRTVYRATPSEATEVARPDMRIVDAELFAKVQREIEKRRRPQSRKGRRPQHLLSGHIKCSACGSNYVVMASTHYCCKGHYLNGVCKNGWAIKRTEIERRVLDGLRGLLLERDNVEAIIKATQKHAKAQRANIGNEQAALTKQLAATKKQIDNIVNAIAAGNGAPTILMSKLNELEAQAKLIEAKIKGPKNGAEVFALPNLSKLVIDKIDALEATLANYTPNANEAEVEAAKAVIRGLISSVDVLAVKKKVHEITVVPKIAGILSATIEGLDDDFDFYDFNNAKIIKGLRA